MSMVRTFSELAEGVGAGFATAPEIIADAVANISCDLWRRVPDQIAGGQNVASSFSRGYMNSVCGGRGGNPSPPQVPPGCEPTAVIFAQYTSKSPNSCDQTTYAHTQAKIPASKESEGTVVVTDSGLYVLRFDDDSEVPFREINKTTFDNKEFRGASPISVFFVPEENPCGSGSGFSSGHSLSVAGSVYFENESEECQNQNRYPETQPIVNPRTTITVNEGDNIQTVNIDVKTDIDGRVSFPLTFTVDKCMEAVVDSSGVTLRNNPSADADGCDQALPFDEPEDTSRDIDIPVVTPPDSPDNEVSFPNGATEEEEEEQVEVEDDELLWVLITIVKPPRRGKTILQKEEQDNNYFAGYFSWVVKEGSLFKMGEQRISKLRMAFPAPQGVAGYRAYTVNGATISIRQIKRKKEEE